MPGGKKVFAFLAWARLCVSLAVLALFIRVFTSSLAQWREARIALMGSQFSGAVSRGGAAIFFWVGLLLLTALFGRWYCGLACPLGTAQEVMRRGFAPLVRSKYIRANRFRYAALFLAGLGLALGVPPLFVLTDPISTFGRGVVGVFDLVTEGLADPVMWVSVAVLAAILAAAAWRGRRFCDWCPVGTLLGLCAAAAPFGVKLDARRCVSCGKCEKVCPMNCAGSKNKTIDRERCVLCLSCVGACGLGAVSYGVVKAEADENFEKAATARRAFFQKIGALSMYASGALYLSGRFLRRSARALLPFPQGGGGGALSPEAALGTALPPGAQNMEHMDIHCVGCKACVAACPADLLRPSPVQPHLDYTRGYCQFNCVECGLVCPAGAIHSLTLEEKHSTRIALSEFSKPNCVAVARKESCGACAEVCPTHALRMVPEGGVTVPEFDPEYCIGCGGCFNVCPAAPSAFTLRGVSPQTRTPGMRRSEPEEANEAVFKEGGEFPF